MTRAPELLVALVAGLDVRNNPLFWPGKLLDTAPTTNTSGEVALVGGVTFKVIRYTRCNGYAGVFFAALGCPIPVGMTANQLFVWFADPNGGVARGWRSVSLLEAVLRADAGYPVAIVAQDQPNGHISVGVPGDGINLFCSSAGAYNTPKQLAASQFGKLFERAKFYTHD